MPPYYGHTAPQLAPPGQLITLARENTTQLLRIVVEVTMTTPTPFAAGEQSSRRTPAVFFGHGSPMNALERNRYSTAWANFGRAVAKPRAILVVSAHWYGNFTAVTAMAQPRTIHDFFGFPQSLFDVDYPAPGSPEVAQEVAEVVKPTRVGLDRDSWGLDHGTWSVLVHAFPEANIPVVQLSIDARRDFQAHVELGASLAPLRERGVLIVGSGNVVHNLRALSWAEPELGFDWTRRFDEAAKGVLTEKPAEAASLKQHADYAQSSPTPDHFIPLLYIAGLAGAANLPLQTLVEGYAFGSLSMASYTLDAKCPTESDNRPSAGLPSPSVVAPEDANV